MSEACTVCGEGRCVCFGVAKVEMGRPDNNPKSAFGMKKPPLHLIPPVALAHEAMAMANGAEKYGAYNWRENSVASTVYVRAAMSHLLAWLDGEECAPDSDVHHLAHARACLGIILDAQEGGNLIDDRPLPGAFPETQKKLTRE